MLYIILIQESTSRRKVQTQSARAFFLLSVSHPYRWQLVRHFWALCCTVRPDASPLWSSRVHLCQCRLGLREPEGHVHRLVHLNSRRQLSAGLLRLASLCIQPAEPPVAVGLERAHAEVVGQGEGLAVIVFGLLARQRLAPRRNHAEEAQSI